MKRNNPRSDEKTTEEINKVYDFLLKHINENYFNDQKFNTFNDLKLSETNNTNNEFDTLIFNAMNKRSNPERAFNDFKKAIENPNIFLLKVLKLSPILIEYTTQFINKSREIDSTPTLPLVSHTSLFSAPPKNHMDNNILCVISQNDTKRFITVIAGVPFYRSSGQNSKEAKTWFPFCGFQEKEFLTSKDKINIGYLIKPNLDKLHTITKYYPLKLSEYYYYRMKNNEKNLKNIFLRLGNFSSMCLSMFIGGGFWDKEEGIELKKLIENNYQDQIRPFYEKYAIAINNIKNFNYDDSNNREIKGTETKDYELINRWLKEHNSLAVESDPWSLNIDFEYNDLKINNNIPKDYKV